MGITDTRPLRSTHQLLVTFSSEQNTIFLNSSLSLSVQRSSTCYISSHHVLGTRELCPNVDKSVILHGLKVKSQKLKVGYITGFKSFIHKFVNELSVAFAFFLCELVITSHLQLKLNGLNHLELRFELNSFERLWSASYSRDFQFTITVCRNDS